METLLLKSTWPKLSHFREKGIFLEQIVFISVFLVEIRISALELTHVENLSQIGQKIKDLEF